MRGTRGRFGVGSVALVGALSLATWGAVVATAPGAGAGAPSLAKATFTEDGTFTVPDGVQCVEFLAAGAAGGTGEYDVEGEGIGGSGGNGGGVAARVFTVPGTVFDVGVGLRGADGGDDGGGGAIGGGDGGDGDTWGGGGGGATFIALGTNPLLIAAGGGGGGAARGDQTGAQGGYGGDVPTAGGDAITATGGGGATDTTGGAAGTNDEGGTEPSEGGDTYGGHGGSDFAGGGGGGGGLFGGGGGGAGNDTAGAGGGGGSNFIEQSAVVGDSSTSDDVSTEDGNGIVEVFYEVGDTSCLTAPLTVKKVVTGVVPAPGTTFTERVTCDAPIQVPLGSDLSASSRDFVFTVDTAGVAQPAAGYTVGFENTGSCTVTETETAGAASVAYTCTSSTITVTVAPEAILPPNTSVCPVAGPTDAPITVNIVRENQTATVTVTNTFAAAIQPTFTG